jgi:hypothetical protein
LLVKKCIEIQWSKYHRKYIQLDRREIRYIKRALLFMLTFAVKINAERERERESSPRL